MADLGGGGGGLGGQNSSSALEIILQIGSYNINFFFCKKCNMLMHANSNPPPPFTKSLDPPLVTQVQQDVCVCVGGGGREGQRADR